MAVDRGRAGIDQAIESIRQLRLRMGRAPVDELLSTLDKALASAALEELATLVGEP
jgi:hypothetical protein